MAEFIDLEGVIAETTGGGQVLVRVSQNNVWGTPAFINITALTADQIKALVLP